MKNRQILFTAAHKAELLETQLRDVGPEDVLVRMEYTAVSGGTERACILDTPNVSHEFPKQLGYCGVGRVRQVGEAVTGIVPGDRVLVYHGVHAAYNVRPVSCITKVEDDSIPSTDAALVIIASMGLGGVRKLELELAESAMIMGQGLLGIFSTQFCRLSGAYPVIAVDLNPERRRLALRLGADAALDPSAPDFREQVMRLTKGKGVNACVEVTGVSAAMKQALTCMAPRGRISLLGCTRVSDCQIDYYSQVHCPGIKLIGAHNFVRPKFESYPHYWTHQDDCKAILDLISAGRIQVAPIISRVVSPEDAPEIFDQLCDDPAFPIGTLFDWRNIE